MWARGYQAFDRCAYDTIGVMNRMLESIIPRVIYAAILTLILPSFVFGQQNRLVDWQPVRILSEARVLEIVDVTVAGKSITLGQPFAANDDWLDTLTFRVRNVSGKPIKLFGFGVAFPDINANGRTPSFSIVYGVDPTKSDTSSGKPLIAEEEVDLKLPADQLEIIRQVRMNLTGTSDLSKVNILPGLATFEDGSRVGGISLRRRLSDKPEK